MKKILALLIAMMLVLSMGVVALADGTITITLPTKEVSPTKPVTYKIYKVFDASVNETDPSKVSYKLCENDTELSAEMIAAGFSVDTAGNVKGPDTLNDAAVAAIAGFVNDADIVDTVVSSVGDASVTSKTLPDGYYYITTSTGSVVTIDTNNANPTVNDKNVLPKVEKSAGTEYDAASLAAIAAVGTDQPFTAQIDVGKGTVNLVFTDTMTNMTYNKDVVITVSAGTAPTADQAKVTETSDGFKVEFDNDYIAGLEEGTIITLKYSGKITSDALSDDPATNKAKITSGDGNENESETVEVYNAKFTVTKLDGEEEPLAGAGFVIKNSEGKFYKLADDKKSITWVTLDDTSAAGITAAVKAKTITENVSAADGTVPAFTGLGVGEYTLIESTVPAGYNKANDRTFEIKDKDYTTDNLEQGATVINEAGVELPSTGSVGTTILYVIGSVLVLAAVVLLVTKRRMNTKD